MKRIGIRREDLGHLVRALLTATAALLIAAPALAEVAVDKVGAEYCGQCHKKEMKAWAESVHARVLSDSDDEQVVEKAESIPEAMGIEDIEIDDACAGCHFTTYLDEEGDEQITAVDCESCHGYGKNWADVHSDYGSNNGKAVSEPADEDPAHKKKRLADSEAAGMVPPAKIVKVAQNCLNCHTGPGEEVVNVGEHSPGSDFELVAWLNGEVRHNFHRTNQGANADVTQDRKRQLYVVGQMLDVEYALRGVAKSSVEGSYLTAMKKRVGDALGRLAAIKGKTSLPEVDQVIAAAKGVGLKPNNSAAAIAAAEKINKIATEFSEKHDGSGLAAVDSLLPSSYHGSPHSG